MKRICVYCGSSPGSSPLFLDAAREVAQRIADRGWGVVYGGAHVGTMGAVADTALAGGTEVTGVIPDCLVDMEVAHQGLTEQHVVRTLHERKLKMTELSDGFAVLPGGHGTMDELFEALTWRQLKIHDKPIVLLNLDGYYDPLVAFLDRAEESGFVQNRYPLSAAGGRNAGRARRAADHRPHVTSSEPVQQRGHALTQMRREDAVESLQDVGAPIARREVRQEHRLVFEQISALGDLVKVSVPLLAALLDRDAIIEEGRFQDQASRFPERTPRVR